MHLIGYIITDIYLRGIWLFLCYMKMICLTQTFVLQEQKILIQKMVVYICVCISLIYFLYKQIHYTHTQRI